MRKFLVRLLCCFIPGKKNRHAVRAALLRSKYAIILEKIESKNQDFQQNIKNINEKIDIVSRNVDFENKKIVDLEQKLDAVLNKIIQDISTVSRNVDFGNGQILLTKDVSMNIQNKSDDIFWDMQVLAQVPLLHSRYKEYKRKFENKDVVLVATGPSAGEYKNIIPGAIHIGVNNAPIKYTNIDFDAVFIQDFFTTNPDLNVQIYNYKPNKCKKFFGVHSWHRLFVNIQNGMMIDRIPQHFFYDIDNVIPYLLMDSYCTKFSVNLESEPFGDIGGSVFSALQFICYTHPRRIFIVGCDCGTTKSASTKTVNDYSGQIKMWQFCKDFISKIYPEIEIISINPIGLRGMFKDIYEENFIKNHPELGNIHTQN